MANVYYTNFSLQSANHAFSAVWKMSRAMKKAGWTVMASSDGTNKDTSGVASNDKWGTSADPSSDTYPTGLDTNAAWICLSTTTPSTQKIPFTAASTGTFLRGEKITQASTAAEGELVGYDFDGTSVGHLVIIPRTGTFNNSNVITGSSSGATLTPSGTIVSFYKEFVFWKAGSSNITTGSIYVQTIDASSESASRFSTLATQSGCTATVAPGGGGTSNAFPSTGSYVMLGTTTGGTSPTITHSNWLLTTTNLGKCQIVATNATAATGVSPDLTFWMMAGDTTLATACAFWGNFRCDNSEDGDLDPFVTFLPSTSTTRIAASAVTFYNNISGQFFVSVGASSGVGWRGWRRRGYASTDAWTSLASAQLYFGVSTTAVGGNNTANPEAIACSNATKRLREKLWILSADNTLKIRKGCPRWIDLCQSGTTYDTLDTKLRICIFPFTTNQNASGYVGPYDGTTTPLQA